MGGSIAAPLLFGPLARGGAFAHHEGQRKGGPSWSRMGMWAAAPATGLAWAGEQREQHWQPGLPLSF